jgi:hypothetical protein
MGDPHEGKELDLMLAGKKPLATFIAEVDAEIPEKYIPEKAFYPYVQSGKIKRFSEDYYPLKIERHVRYVCFTLLGEEWRAEFFLWFARQRYGVGISYDPSHEYIIGRLLGYSNDEMGKYIEYIKSSA